MKKNYLLGAAMALTMCLSASAQSLPEELYLCGTPNNWTVPAEASEDQLIVLSPTSEGIYECTFSYDAEANGPLEFKIFSKKGTWADVNDTWGSFDPAKSYTPGTPIMWYGMIQGDGWGNFIVSNWSAPEAHMTVDWLSKTIELSDGLDPTPPQSLHLVGDFNDWDSTNHDYELGLFVGEVEGTHYTGSFILPAGQFMILTQDDWYNCYGCDQAYDLWKGETKELQMSLNGNNFNCRNWKEGEIMIDVDWDNKIISFTAPDQPEYYEPETLHLVGVFNDWDPANHDYELTRDMSVNHPVYRGTFEIAEDQFQFKVLEADTWDISYGSYDTGFDLWNSEPLTIGMQTDGNNISCANWKGGKLEVTVDWNTRSLTLVGPDQPKYEKKDVLYLIGAPQGWNINSGAMTLERISEDKYIYGGSFEIKEGDAMFRFYISLGDWEFNSIGSQYEDNPIDITLTEEQPYKGDAFWGKGSWNIPDWKGGEIYMKVDMDTMTVEFSAVDSGIGSVVGGNTQMTYSNGIVTSQESSHFTVTDAAGRIIMRVSGNSADLRQLPHGLYIIKAGKSALKVMK